MHINRANEIIIVGAVRRRAEGEATEVWGECEMQEVLWKKQEL